jgi:hypothetical protein
LRFTENEGENRDVEIDRYYSQHSPGIGGKKTLHTMQDFRRMVLLPLSVVGKIGIQPDREYFAGDAKSILNDRAEIVQQPVIDVPDRQQLYQLHQGSSQFPVLNGQFRVKD